MTINPKKFYRRDMEINVNGIAGKGVVVAPQANTYEIEVKSSGKLDLFTFSTCHREIIKESAGGGIFGNKKKTKFSYSPVKGLETGQSCVAIFGGYERVKGRHSWGIVDFEGPDANLPAVIRCNGSEYNSRGVAICQSREGLYQEIEFVNEVITSDKAKCKGLTTKDNKKFRYKTQARNCVYRFMEKASGKMHRLTTIGYQEILIREN